MWRTDENFKKVENYKNRLESLRSDLYGDMIGVLVCGSDNLRRKGMYYPTIDLKHIDIFLRPRRIMRGYPTASNRYVYRKRGLLGPNGAVFRSDEDICRDQETAQIRFVWDRWDR